MESSARSCDIAIVGAGPAGLAAAIALRQTGHDALCIGPAPQAGTPDRRTTALLSGSVAFLNSLGLWQTLKASAAPLRTLRLIDRTGRLFRAPDMAFNAAEIGQDAFGYNIPNHTLITALMEHLAEGHVRTAEVRAVDVCDKSVKLSLEGGPTLRARLVVGADGRNSLCRDAAGIATRGWTYEQTAVVGNFRHSRAHQGACTELHFAAGPFTVVPLPGDWSSLVWVERPAEASRLMSLSAEAYAEAIARRLEGVLGNIAEVGARAAFPLSGLMARGLARNRVALIGEAAHVIPPIGAQGLNLGFRDVADLRRAVEGASDPGAPDVLARYERARRGDILARTLAADLLNRTLISTFLPLQLARGVGLAGLAMIPPLRRMAMRQGMSAP